MLIQNSDARLSQSLNGQWDIIIDPYQGGYYNHRYEENPKGYFLNQKRNAISDLIEYDFASSQKLTVPGDWNTQDDRLFFYEGTIWYHREFEQEKEPDKRYILYFGAVNYKATVYVNGQKVGTHEGGFTSFQFDVTKNLKSGHNFVVLMVDNRRERDHIPTVNTDWWNYGGITRPVKLIEVTTTYLADYFIQYQSENSILGWVKLDGDLTTNIEDVTVSLPELNLSTQVKINQEGYGEFKFQADPILWSPATPKLYELILTYRDCQVVDQVGFRTIAVQGDNIYLNGESIFLRGINLHEESPRGDGRAWSLEDARTLLTWAKELNCNFVRLAHYPHNEIIVRLADEMGLLVWSEIPVYWTILFDREDVYAKAEKQLQEMIARDKNRAAIILWSVANETPNHEDRLRFLTRLVQAARSVDSSRLITAAMDTQSSTEQGNVIDDPLADVVDVIGINSYCGWYIHPPEACSEMRWHSSYNKPIIMSEFGAGALQGKFGDEQERFTEENQALVYRKNIEMFGNIPQLRGVTPWILQDFRSPHRPLPAIQDFWNRKGLISERGIKKKAWHILEAWYRDLEARLPVKLRPAILLDRDRVYNLMVQQNIADFGDALLSVDDLRQRWHDSEFSLDKHTRVEVTPDGRLLGYAEIRPYTSTQFSTQLYLASNSSSELGTQLLTSLEANLASDTQLIAQVSGKNSQNQQIFVEAGYERGLTFLIMEIEMDEAPLAAVWPEGVTVRPFIPHQDEQATYETDEAASRDKGYSKPLSFAAWSKRMSLNTERFDPTLWFLACHKEETVGVSLNFYLPENDSGLIDHLGVRRSWRGRGIGLALLQHSFAAFYARGVKKVQLSVDSGSLTNAPRLYEKAGMKTVQTYHIYSKTITT